MLNDTQKKEIEKLVGEMQCPKGFVCYESGFKMLCKAKEHGLKSFLKCLEDSDTYCHFSISFGGERFCRCPLRVYISREIKKSGE